MSNVKMVIVDFGNTGSDHKHLVDVAEAITIQTQRDFGVLPPYGYGIGAEIRVGTQADKKPDEWLIGLFEKPDQPGALGYHDETVDGQPFMKIFPLLDKQDGSDVAVTISHEVLECLADPNGARGAQDVHGKFWAYEVCDAVEQLSYPIKVSSGKEIQVSDFVLPTYFEYVKNATKFDFMGAVKHQLEVLPGGYNQYFDPQKGWVMVQNNTKSPRTYRMRTGGRSSTRRLKFQVS